MQSTTNGVQGKLEDVCDFAVVTPFEFSEHKNSLVLATEIGDGPLNLLDALLAEQPIVL